MRRSCVFLFLPQLVLAAAVEGHVLSSARGTLEIGTDHGATVVEERASVSRPSVPSSAAPVAEVRTSDLWVKKRKSKREVVSLDPFSSPEMDNLVRLPNVSHMKSRRRSKTLMLLVDLIPAAVFVGLLLYLRRPGSVRSVRGSLAWAANWLAGNVGTNVSRWIPVNPEPEQYWETTGGDGDADDASDTSDTEET